jgi:hypothetical protein
VIVPVISCAQRTLCSLVEILTDSRRGSLKNNTDNALWKGLTPSFAFVLLIRVLLIPISLIGAILYFMTRRHQQES